MTASGLADASVSNGVTTSAHSMPFGGPFDWTGVAFAALVAFVALTILVRFARTVRLSDDGSDAPERKHSGGSVPLVGGTALALAALALCVWPVMGDLRALVPWIPADPWSFEPRAFVLALALAFGTGLVDDLRDAGLSPAWKLLGQFAAGVALATGLRWSAGADLVFEPATFGERAIVVLVAVAAQNVANTFDHADGMLGSVTFVAFASAGSSFAGALGAFLGFNLTRRSRGGPPRAFLGDSGSHALGLLLMTSTVGLAALTLPAIDLARVLVLRARAGHPLWTGDRRHLGQRLRAAGRGPVATVLIALVCATPAFAALAFRGGFDTALTPRGGLDTALTPRGGFDTALTPRGGFDSEGSHLPASWELLGLGAIGCALLLLLALRLHPTPPSPDSRAS